MVNYIRLLYAILLLAGLMVIIADVFYFNPPRLGEAILIGVCVGIFDRRLIREENKSKR